jgi:hypothetical protein
MKIRTELTAEHLREVLHYDPDTGIFRWRIKRNGYGGGTKPGMIAGTIGANGYRYIGLDQKPLLAHRLAFLYVNGHWPAKCIDHIDGDPLNNCYANLREATHQQNMSNIKKHRTNTSGFRGVSFQHNGYLAQIYLNGSSRYLGRFKTAEEASAAYERVAREARGEFYREAT